MFKASDVYEMKEEDVDQVFLLSSRIGEVKTKREDVLACVEDENLSGYVLKDASLHGYVLVRLEGYEAEIDQIAVFEEDEGKGVASFLLNEVVSLLKERGVRKVFLEVREDNARAISLYERQGFVPYNVRKNYYGDKNAVLMSKELAL